MRLRRHPAPADYEPGPDFYRHLRRLWRAFDRGYALCRELTPQTFGDGLDDEQRASALAHARKLSFETNFMRLAVDTRFDAEKIYAGLLPLSFLGAAARLTFALGTMAETDPTPEALLTQAELDGLLDHAELRVWVETVRGVLSEPQA